jgi:hypothetical protein
MFASLTRKIDWIAAIVIGAGSLVILYFVREAAPRLFGDTGTTIVDIIGGLWILFLPAVIGGWLRRSWQQKK